jgi:hypothetical protein
VAKSGEKEEIYRLGEVNKEESEGVNSEEDVRV